MTYQDTIEQAESKLQKALVFLKQHRLAASPINYSVAYEYASAENTDIVEAINNDIKDSCIIDSFLMEELYRQYMLSSDENSEKILRRTSSIINTTQKHSQKAQRDSKSYAFILDEALLLLDDPNPETSKQVVDKLIKATSYTKNTQQILFKALQQAQTKSKELQQHIENLHENRQLDALTGLYNRSVMNQTVDIWVKNNTQNIAALAINLDHFKQFNDSYGMTVGNVILSKVAQKIKSYVSETGLPVRLAGEEFLVLIPDATPTSANEIAEKVRLGVENLQFVNAKNKAKLPKITISIGVTEYCHTLGLNGTIQKATSALRMAKATGRNRVYSS
jgi:diguanylate cyclase